MRCPECGKKSVVIDSRSGSSVGSEHLSDQEVTRRRECNKGHRFTTIETIHGSTQKAEIRKRIIDAIFYIGHEIKKL